MAADPGDELYALPLAEFTARRDALVKELKAAGEKDAAAEVKARRKPTVAAWAVNQVVRTTAGKNDVAALLQLGDRLRDAHDALLEGKGDAAIRELTAERRALVAKLAKQAVAALGPGGEAQREAVTHTFDAAVADPEAGLVVRSGRLVKELAAPSGFGGGLVFSDAIAAGTRPRRDERPSRRQVRPEPTTATAAAACSEPEAQAAAKPTAAERQAARDAAKAAERRRKQLQHEADDRASEAEQAARDAAAAGQEVSRLQDLLVTATATAEAAADRAQRAEAAAEAARRALRDAEAEAEAAAP